MFAIATCLTVLAIAITISAQTTNKTITITDLRKEYLLLKDLQVKDHGNLTGDSVKISTFPYVVSLLDKKRQSICTGILISPILVLTAAHCVSDDVISVAYFFGTPRQIIIPVSRGVQHPGFQLKLNAERKSVTDVKDDIGILYLEKDLLSQKYYLAHHLMQFPISDPKVNDNVSAYGFGFGTRSSGYLRRIGMVIVDCKRNGIVGKLVCAKVCDTEAGVGRYCAGDSGEPLVTPDGVVVGIASLGTRSCLADAEDSVNTFVNLNQYIPWIERVSSYYNIDYSDNGRSKCGNCRVVYNVIICLYSLLK